MTQRQSCNKTKYMIFTSLKNTNFLSVYANNKSFPTDLGIIIQYVDWNQFSQLRRTPEAAASRSRHCKRKFPSFKDNIQKLRQSLNNIPTAVGLLDVQDYGSDSTLFATTISNISTVIRCFIFFVLQRDNLKCSRYRYPIILS